MRVLGVDPGLNGGMSIIETSAPFDLARIVAAGLLPTAGEDAKRRIDASALHGWLQTHRPSVAFIERAQAMPKQGSSSGFIYGRAVGALEATILCSGIRLEVIESRAWKQRFNLGGGDKEGSRQKALMMFPEQASLFARKKDHQVAEATLIAMFGADLMKPMQVTGIKR